ncbi:MAG: histidine phosphatase family protein [Planctomycetes bacterium]|nr:histidine phosphatase family protein [Planctomycetota bacterium]
MKGGQAAGGDFEPATRSAMPQDEVTTIHILRHGDVSDLGERRARGQLDVPLTARGLAQHERLAAWFVACEPRPDVVVSSDLSRCRELADRVGSALGIEVRTDPALREQSLGDWEGRSWDEITRELGAAVNDYWDDYFASRPPNGESLSDLHARVGAWWASARDELAGQRVVIVGHVGVIRALACWFLSIPATEALRFAPAVASHTRFLLAEPGAVLEVFGERPWLRVEDGAEPTRTRAQNGPRIALSGSAGTGKSTLGRALAAQLGVPYLEERMRLRLENGLRLVDLSPAEWRALIRELWDEHAAEEARCEAGFVADRSSLDYLAFWLHYGLYGDEAETEDFVARMRAHAERYDRVLLFPFGVLPLESDGVRATNPWVQLRFQTILEGVLERWAESATVLRVPATANFDERLKHMLDALACTARDQR